MCKIRIKKLDKLSDLHIFLNCKNIKRSEMKIGLSQNNPIIGNIEYNKAKILSGYKKGIGESARY